jgi:hypothetical protein
MVTYFIIIPYSKKNKVEITPFRFMKLERCKILIWITYFDNVLNSIL